MKIGDKIFYNGIEYTVLLIEEEVVHLLNNMNGICILKTEL